MGFTKAKRAQFFQLANHGKSLAEIWDSKCITGVSYKDMNDEYQSLIVTKGIKAAIAPGAILKASNSSGNLPFYYLSNSSKTKDT
jgi:hypothetical protein